MKARIIEALKTNLAEQADKRLGHFEFNKHWQELGYADAVYDGDLSVDELAEAVMKVIQAEQAAPPK